MSHLNFNRYIFKALNSNKTQSHQYDISFSIKILHQHTSI